MPVPTATVPSPSLQARPMSSGPAVEVFGLSKRYGDKAAVDQLSFEVPAGTVCGFIGPNGAGKTTTIRMLLGLIAPTEGSAKVLGHPVTDPSSYIHRVGAMIEGPAFYPTLSGRRNLEVLARLARVDSSRVGHVLDAVAMTDRADGQFRSFSLGMKQRIGLAAALLSDPELLILDEPTNGLDPPGIREVRDLLRGLADEGRTVLVSSHLLDELQHIIDHVVVINEGRALFDGTFPELMASQHPRLIVQPEHQSDLVEVAALCERVGLAAAIVEGAVHLDASADRAAWLNKTAMGSGITLVSIIAVQPRLEDVFFDMTEGPRT